VAIVLQQFVMNALGVPFWLTVLVTIFLIWIYTFKGGIKTIIWTDTLQTLCMLIAVILTIGYIGSAMNLSVGGLIDVVKNSDYSQIFFFDQGWSDSKNFVKQFLAGMFIAIVMTGLDQDMMQKNLSCRNIKEAQLNMFSFSVVLVFVNLLFLGLGALLYLYAAQIGVSVERSDLLYATLAIEHLSPVVGVVFVLGLIAAAYSSADSALTSLTTSFCIDFLGFENKATTSENTLFGSQKTTRFIVHVGFSVLLFFVILIFWYINDEAVIKQIFTVASYTYGPLLGLYAFGFFTTLHIRDKFTPLVCLLAPVLTYIINSNSEQWLNGYKFGFELLLLNGLLTFVGLLLITNYKKTAPVLQES
jgi:Na+/proline symporter